MAERYRKSVANLRDALNRPEGRSEASGYLRRMIEKVVLTPVEGKEGLQIDLYGDLAGILNLSRSKGKDRGSERENLKRLRLLPSNDNSPEALIDRVGSRGWI